MSIPSFAHFKTAVLKIAGEGGEIMLSDAYKKVSDELELTPAEREIMLPSGVMAVAKSRTSWAVTFLVKAKLLCRPKRGCFEITDLGRDILKKEVGIIDTKFLMQFKDFAEFQTRKNQSTHINDSDDGDDALSNPDERIHAAHSEITLALEEEVLSSVLDMSPEFFEGLIVKLLLSMGYGGSDDDAGRRLGKSGDGGIDGIIYEDKLGLDIIYIQAKRYAPENSVPRPDVQRFVGALNYHNASKGVFVTTSSFGKSVRDYANTVPQRIILIDGKDLASHMVKYNVGVRVDQIIKIKKIDGDFFQEE